MRPTSSRASASAHSVRFADLRVRARPAGEVAHEQRPLGRAVAAVHHRVRGDRRVAVVLGDHLGRGLAVDRGLHALGVGRLDRRRASPQYTPNTCFVMCMPTPLTSPVASGSARSRSTIAAIECVRYPLAGTAVIRQAAGDGEAARIVGGEMPSASHAKCNELAKHE